MIVLDTDVLIEVIKRKIIPKDWSISVITLIEFLRGVNLDKIENVKERPEKAFTIIPLTNNVVKNYCILCQYLKESGILIPDADLLIAATSIALKAPLATWNAKHFNRLKEKGLKLIDPAKLGI